MSAGARTLSHTPDVNVSKEETKKIREYKKKYSSRHHVLFHSKNFDDQSRAAVRLPQEFMNHLIDYVLFT
jgi:hypothetical protein